MVFVLYSYFFLLFDEENIKCGVIEMQIIASMGIMKIKSETI